MSATTDKQIADILATYGEPLAGNVWRVQGTAVIYHKALERIAVQARIRFDAPVIVRAERDEAVILVTGHMPGPNGDRTEWSIGEALIGVNYRVSGRQAAYVFAMAEKRAKDRVILKLAGLHGLLYSEDEADEFKASRPDLVAANSAANQSRKPEPMREPRETEEAERDTEAANDSDASRAGEEPGRAEAASSEAELTARIDEAQSINAVTDLMLAPETQAALAAMPPGVRDEVREHAKARLVALGWPARSNAKSRKAAVA
ncbi:trna delta -isopentenylpyrophosphate transferase [Methylobacterium currus]|uniref:Trna delta-isopentenylpyrophosphate transferase n=1 Tax=Methylobacterium currus TaxID=2051553 RepID=A0A2R4WTE8_9HYPH|nr:trna delta -isopentenylpyrophosphate transferase [Methylobacterium currus]AWB24789.1 trna delta -isopentenylpyrophosphate transferase [Methylobacterium currus]UHC14101.1 trna delta -isopentenylpyrophosphate transferase [Methylobacterium currus]